MSSELRDGNERRTPAVCDDLAARLASPEGLETARLLQAVGLLGNPAGAPAGPAAEGETTDAAAERSALAATAGRRRLCLIGESAAAGFFLAPWLTPAKVLAEQLSAFGEFEVLDRARPGMLLQELVETVGEALKAPLDLLIVFAGNNWLGLGPPSDQYADQDLASFQEHAEAIRQYGIGGLRRLADERMRRRARAAIDRVAPLAAAAGVPLLFVVPAANLVDFESLHPVPWLPGDGVDRWYVLYSRALAGLEAGDSATAADAAREMIALDAGECPTSHRLLAAALLAAGRTGEAHAPLEAHLDTSCWDHRFGRGSSAPAVVRNELLAGCRRQGLTVVDLPARYAEITGTPLTDRRLFLDHCHLSAEGIRIGMAAVAAEALRLCGLEAPDWKNLALPASSSPAVPPGVAALSKLHAGLYNAHMNRPAAGGHAPVTEALFAAALDEAPGAAESMQDYIEAMTAPGRAFLTAACARNQASPYPLQPLAWLPSDLGIDALEPICRALDGHGLPGRDELDRWLLEHHAVDRQERDLARPKYRERDAGASSSYVLRQAVPAIFRALWPTSVFYLVTDGTRELRLRLSLRLPVSGAGSVSLGLNGVSVGSVQGGDRWTDHELKLDRGRFRRGLNRLSLSWPALGDAGAQALQTAVQRLRQGLPSDIFPVFGEVFSLQAGPAPAL